MSLIPLSLLLVACPGRGRSSKSGKPKTTLQACQEVDRKAPLCLNGICEKTIPISPGEEVGESPAALFQPGTGNWQDAIESFEIRKGSFGGTVESNAGGGAGRSVAAVNPSGAFAGFSGAPSSAGARGAGPFTILAGLRPAKDPTKLIPLGPGASGSITVIAKTVCQLSSTFAINVKIRGQEFTEGALAGHTKVNNVLIKTNGDSVSREQLRQAHEQINNEGHSDPEA